MARVPPLLYRKAVNRVDWYYRQLVTEGDMDGADDLVESAIWNLSVDTGLHGVMSGLVLAENGVPDLSVVVSGPGVAYDQTGRRIFVPTDQPVDVEFDSSNVATEVSLPGNVRIISVYVKYDRELSNLKKDGNNVDVFYDIDESYAFIVEQSAEGVDPPPPALKADAKLLGDITREFGANTIQNSDISFERTQYAFDLTAGSLRVTGGTAEEAAQGILTALNEHLTDLSAAHTTAAIEGTEVDPGNGHVLAANDLETQISDIYYETTGHMEQTNGAHEATAIAFNAAGNIAALTVQAAIQELDTEKGGLNTGNSWLQLNTFGQGFAVFNTCLISAPEVDYYAAGANQAIVYKLWDAANFNEIEKQFEVYATGTPAAVALDTALDGYITRYRVEVVICRQGVAASAQGATLTATFRRTGGTTTLMAQTYLDNHGTEGGILSIGNSGATVNLNLSSPTNNMNIHAFVHAYRVKISA